MKYEISNGTLAIVPNEDDNSLIYEDNERFIVEESPFKIMEDSCKYFGSTYKGRNDSAKEILGAEFKIPVVIEASTYLIVFPTTSPIAEDCAWICLNRVKNINKLDSFNTKITFDNDKELIVPCSYRSIENQLS